MNFIDTTPISSLTGTSKEREVLANEIKDAYEASLQLDREKEEEEKKEKANKNRLLSLMQSRKQRVPLEPSLHEPHVTISVRHIELGNKVRLFKDDCLFTAVYDWIGSICTDPEFFELKDHRGNTIPPNDSVFSGTFNMSPCLSPVPMTPTGTVSFRGFGTITNQTNGNNSIINIDSQDDLFEECNEPDVQDYLLLGAVREAAFQRLNHVITEKVSRENVFDDMMSLYKKRNIASHKISISFKGEDAEGDGVSRDAFSAFFNSAYNKMDGYSEKVPSTRFSEEDVRTLGKIITHAYICFNVFPTGLCKTAFKKGLNIEVRDEDFLASFLHFIHPKEAEIVHKCSKGTLGNVQPIMDILFEYSIFTKPTKENIMDLMAKAAKIALLNKPCYLMQQLAYGLGNFWNKITGEMIETLYSSTLPTSEKIISSLIPNEKCPQDQKVFTWLNRFIRGLSVRELGVFLRFVTGSNNFQPDMKMRIEFVDQPTSFLRPCSQTCFKILLLPRQYSSFTEMAENLKMHMENTDNWSVHDGIFNVTEN